MDMENQDHIIESYRRSFRQYGDTAEGLQFSEEGQRWRFEKLMNMAALASGESLQGKRLLEIGYGLGHFYPILRSLPGKVDYTGIDIVPELIAHAAKAYPEATFECRDIFKAPLLQEFDFVFISGVFNAPSREDNQKFMSSFLEHAFSAARVSPTFNFTSTYVNFVTPNTNYFNPDWLLRETLERLSKKVLIHHHYRNSDVAVSVCR